MNTKTYTLKLILTPREVELLRNSTSDLGMSDSNCLSLQLKIANAILETDFPENKNKKYIIREMGVPNMVLGKSDSFSDNPFEWVSFSTVTDAQNKLLELDLSEIAYYEEMK